MRDFKRFGVREGLIECRSVCRSPTAKASGHLTKKESIRPCYEKGTYVKPTEPQKPKREKPVVTTSGKQVKKMLHGTQRTEAVEYVPKEQEVVNQLSASKKTLVRNA